MGSDFRETVRRRAHPLRLTVAGAVVSLAATLSTAVLAIERDPHLYTVPLGTIPTSATEALASIETRKRAILASVACEDDASYWARTWSGNPRDQAGEGLMFASIGKVGYLASRHAAFVATPDVIACRGTQDISLPDLALPGTTEAQARSLMLGAIGGMTDPLELEAIDAGRLLAEPRVRDAINALVPATFGPACAATVTQVVLLPFDAAKLNEARGKPAAERGGYIRARIEYALSLGCMRAQINAALLKKQVVGLLGSSHVPCLLERDEAGNTHYAEPGFSAFETTGEWDVDVRDLVRVLHLHRRTTVAGADGAFAPWLLDPPVAKHIQENLLTVDGPTGADSYSLLECGNQEHSTGSPTERLSQRDWIEEALDSLGSFFEWLFRRALLIAAVLAVGTLAVVLFPAFLPAVVLAAAAAVVVVGTGRIPETENHRLMIETSRYLNNQLILDDLRALHPDEDRDALERDQRAVRDWLMARLRRIFHEDFDEYNARPYQRYSLTAILNLAEFAHDRAMQDAAHLVLDTTVAKFAVASNDSVRVVPLRRLRGSVNTAYLCEGVPATCSSITDLTGSADHMVGLMQLYGGQARATEGRMSRAAARELASAATSRYAPPPPILSIAIVDAQRSPRLQIRNHTVPEITYSTRGFLLTAGSVTSGPANRLELDLLGQTIVSVGGKRDDEGTGVPTTLQLRPARGLPATAEPKTTPFPDPTFLANMLRIHGKFESNQEHRWSTSVGLLERTKDAEPSFDRNLCVFEGFACGMNFGVPPEYARCLSPEPAIASLSFIDTGACASLRNVSRVYIALSRVPCSEAATEEGCVLDMGFFEAFDPGVEGSPGFVTFDQFKARVRDRNPGRAMRAFGCHDTYVMSTGAGIAYRCDDEHGIREVGAAAMAAYTDEKPARGSVIARSQGGYVHRIGDPDLPGAPRATLDWSDEHAPKRHW